MDNHDTNKLKVASWIAIRSLCAGRSTQVSPAAVRVGPCL